MIKTRTLFTLLCLVALPMSVFSQSSNAIWDSYSKDPEIIHKVDSLRNLMTVDEKIGQLNMYNGNFTLTGEVKETKADYYMSRGMIGSIFNEFGTKRLRELQETNLKNSRLKIPIIFAADVIHGLETTFPIPLAEACSWDLDLIERSARIAAEETTASGIVWNFAPMIDVARDPRWGRVIEGSGEDVYLGSEIAKARVEGFQGISGYKDLKKNNTLIATAKHFIAYGAAQAGRDYHSVDMSDIELRRTYLPPFQAAINAGVGTVMTAFNDYNGVPATGNQYLFKDLLRGEMDFNGLVVTDYTAINEMIDHGYSKDLKHAAAQAMDATIDMDMIGEGYATYMKELIQEGTIEMEQLDIAVSRVLEMKFMLGLFDDPFMYFDEKREKATLMKPEYVKEARINAQRSIVLLKNKDNTLPLATTEKKKIALIGPFIKSREDLNGEWAIKGDRKKTVTLEEGLIEAFKDSEVQFKYALGTSYNDDDNSQEGFKAAIKAAKSSDIIIAAMGESYHWSGEAASRTEITLPGQQRELLKELKKLGKPIVLVLFNGRPLDLSWEDENLDAIVEAWYPGLMAGHAVTDILTGKYNPSAKLVMTFPRNVGQIPIFYNVKNTGRPFDPENPRDYRSFYLDSPNSPLYPFGYGLSYTQFDYSNLTLSSPSLSENGSITASITVKNSGDYDGEEVIQLYIRDRVASITQPIKSLRGFEKIALKKGESKTVSFEINKETLQFLGASKQFITEPGEFDIWVASSSNDDTNHAKITLK